MNKNLLHVKKALDKWVLARNTPFELSKEAYADPLQVARENKDEFHALICALFGYGNARAIVNFLRSLDFSLLHESEKNIRQALQGKVYRFQNAQDIAEFFITLRRAKKENSLEDIFLQTYQNSQDTIQSINHLQKTLYKLNPYNSRGYTFLIGKTFEKEPLSTYKRWNMYLRWMVRKDTLDMGLWNGVNKAHLLAPLDTHTHKMALKFGLIKRKSYDFKAAQELTQTFKLFDKTDPIKYDFALYRLGQEKKEL